MEEKISVETYNEAIDVIEGGYQSKRTRLKKQLTHWIGKFMIVKQENNKLRSINTAITKRNAELALRISDLETLGIDSIAKRRVQHNFCGGVEEMAKVVHRKEPVKC